MRPLTAPGFNSTHSSHPPPTDLTFPLSLHEAYDHWAGQWQDNHGLIVHSGGRLKRWAYCLWHNRVVIASPCPNIQGQRSRPTVPIPSQWRHHLRLSFECFLWALDLKTVTCCPAQKDKTQGGVGDKSGSGYCVGKRMNYGILQGMCGGLWALKNVPHGTKGLQLDGCNPRTFVWTRKEVWWYLRQHRWFLFRRSQINK